MAHKSRAREQRRLQNRDRWSWNAIEALQSQLPEAIFIRVYRIEKEPFGGDYVVLMHGAKLHDRSRHSVVRIPRAIWKAGGAAAKICLEAP